MMKSLLIALACIAVIGLASPGRAEEYVCAPCGMECDLKTFDKPGSCPDCGLALVARAASASTAAAATPAPPQHTAAILLFPGVQIIDYTGPYEVFGQGGFRVRTVARTAEPITTAMGMKVVPEYTFETCPPSEVLIVPGGGIASAYQDSSTIDWIRRTAAKSAYTMSVCNGAFLIARAGLLDGKGATTFHRMIDDLARDYPQVHVVSDQRFVDNGTVITTAGLSSGIDGSLHLLEKMLGPTRAKEIALNMEYDWRPEAGFARAALADMKLPPIDPPGIRDPRVVETAGDREHWTKSWECASDLGPDELAAGIDREIAKTIWKRVTTTTGARAGGSGKSQWSFADDQGKPWTGTVSVAKAATAGRFRVTIAVARKG